MSNALHRPDRLAAATREKVMQAVRETGYRPSLPARQLATRRAQAIAVRADRPQDGISGMVLDIFFHGLAEAGERSGNRVVLYPEQADEAAELATVEDLVGSGAADAVVLTATNVRDGRPAHLIAAGLTFCAFGRPWGTDEPPHDWVDVDGAHGTAQAVRHLLAAGRRRIGFLGWPDDAATGRDRRRGWLEALATADLAGTPTEAACHNTARQAAAETADMLRRDPDLDAWCARATRSPWGPTGPPPRPGATSPSSASTPRRSRPPWAWPACPSPSARSPTPASTCCSPGVRGEHPARGVLLEPSLAVPT